MYFRVRTDFGMNLKLKKQTIYLIIVIFNFKTKARRTVRSMVGRVRHSKLHFVVIVSVTHTDLYVILF